MVLTRCSTLLAAALILAACAGRDPGAAGDAGTDGVGSAASGPAASAAAPSDASPGAGDGTGAGSGTDGPLALILPAASTLHPAVHAELVVAADVALAAAAVDGPTRRSVLPRDDALPDVLAALAPGSGALCAVGVGALPALGAVRLRWAEVPVCATPGAQDAGGVAVAPVDVAALGARLGRLARAAAGSRTVVVLATGDPLLGADWAAAVAAGAGAGPVRVLGDVAGLDVTGPAAPAGPTATAGPTAGEVGVVVLDGGPGAAAALAALDGTPVLLVVPAALTSAADAPDPARVLARYRVRWDAVLAPLLRRVRGADGTAPSDASVLEVATGPAVLPGPGGDGP